MEGVVRQNMQEAVKSIDDMKKDIGDAVTKMNKVEELFKECSHCVLVAQKASNNIDATEQPTPAPCTW